jgi:hypothetical protein
MQSDVSTIHRSSISHLAGNPPTPESSQESRPISPTWSAHSCPKCRPWKTENMSMCSKWVTMAVIVSAAQIAAAASHGSCRHASRIGPGVSQTKINPKFLPFIDHVLITGLKFGMPESMKQSIRSSDWFPNGAAATAGGGYANCADCQLGRVKRHPHRTSR